MKFIKLNLAVVIGFFPLILMAEETGLRFTIGPIYRDFDDVDFKATPFRNAGNAGVPGGPFGVQNYTTLTFPDTNPRTVTADYIQSGGGDDNIDTGSLWGPMLGMEYDIVDNVEYVISFVSNFQFFSIQADSGGGFNATHFNQDAVFNPGIGTHVVTPVTPGDPGTPGLSPGTTVSSGKSEFDMELYVFDAGLKISMVNFDPLRIGLAAGPTLSIGDVDTSQAGQSATWNPTIAPEDTGSFTGSSAQSRSDVDFILGLYTALEAAYRLTETFSLALGVRYDLNTVDVGTSIADMDLETVGGYARLVLDF